MSGLWRLSDEQVERVHGHLVRFNVSGCPICGRNDWKVHPLVTGEKPFDPEATYFAIADAAAKVRLTCANCGYVLYFSTDAIGISADNPNE